MDNHKKWGPVINQSFVDGIPMVDVLEAVWQHATKDAIKEMQEYMTFAISSNQMVPRLLKKNIIKMINDVAKKMNMAVGENNG